MTVPVWAGARVTELRRQYAQRLPCVCEVCGEWIRPGDDWQIGHRLPRVEHPQLTWQPSNHRLEHTACNLAGGARLATRRRVGGISPGWR